MSDLHKAILCCLAGIAAALIFCVTLSHRTDVLSRRIDGIEARFPMVAAVREHTNVYWFSDMPNNIHRWQTNEGGVYWLTVEVGLATNSGQLVWRNHTN